MDDWRPLIFRYFPKNIYLIAMYVIAVIALGSAIFFTHISQITCGVKFTTGGIAGAFEGNGVIEVTLAQILYTLRDRTPSKTFAYILMAFYGITCYVMPLVLSGFVFCVFFSLKKKQVLILFQPRCNLFTKKKHSFFFI